MRDQDGHRIPEAFAVPAVQDAPQRVVDAVSILVEDDVAVGRVHPDLARGIPRRVEAGAGDEEVQRLAVPERIAGLIQVDEDVQVVEEMRAGVDRERRRCEEVLRELPDFIDVPEAGHLGELLVARRIEAEVGARSDRRDRGPRLVHDVAEGAVQGDGDRSGPSTGELVAPVGAGEDRLVPAGHLQVRQRARLRVRRRREGRFVGRQVSSLDRTGGRRIGPVDVILVVVVVPVVDAHEESAPERELQVVGLDDVRPDETSRLVLELPDLQAWGVVPPVDIDVRLEAGIFVVSTRLLDSDLLELILQPPAFLLELPACLSDIQAVEFLPARHVPLRDDHRPLDRTRLVGDHLLARLLRKLRLLVSVAVV